MGCRKILSLTLRKGRDEQGKVLKVPPEGQLCPLKKDHRFGVSEKRTEANFEPK